VALGTKLGIGNGNWELGTGTRKRTWRSMGRNRMEWTGKVNGVAWNGKSIYQFMASFVKDTGISRPNGIWTSEKLLFCVGSDCMASC
jgi:hypothetical protein